MHTQLLYTPQCILQWHHDITSAAKDFHPQNTTQMLQLSYENSLNMADQQCEGRLVWPARPNFPFGEEKLTTISRNVKLGLAGQTRVGRSLTCSLVGCLAVAGAGSSFSGPLSFTVSPLSCATTGRFSSSSFSSSILRRRLSI